MSDELSKIRAQHRRPDPSVTDPPPDWRTDPGLRDLLCDPLKSGGGPALRRCFNAMIGEERTNGVLELVDVALRDLLAFVSLPEGERIESRHEEVVVLGEIARTALAGERARRGR
jgi:hypothetical protein